MSKRKQLPVALTIAGSDSGGGAGIQADLKTFAALGVHGTSAITCITAQNPRRVTGIQPVSPDMVRRQVEAVFGELPPTAVKTGMLYSTEIIRVVGDFFARGKRPPLVVDPVMVSTSGAILLKSSAIKILNERLLPLATVTTPNLHEAEIIADQKLDSVEDMRAAARTIYTRFGCAVLVKGGHLRGLKEAADVFYDGREELLLTAPFIQGISTHGTGCTYSAAVAGYLARGHTLTRAVAAAKRHVTWAIAQSYAVDGHWSLRHAGVPKFL
jgi:hydroxymethylpyrimidine/phosphomethylpyrimidine kinase